MQAGDIAALAAQLSDDSNQFVAVGQRLKLKKLATEMTGSTGVAGNLHLSAEIAGLFEIQGCSPQYHELAYATAAQKAFDQWIRGCVIGTTKYTVLKAMKQSPLGLKTVGGKLYVNFDPFYDAVDGALADGRGEEEVQYVLLWMFAYWLHAQCDGQRSVEAILRVLTGQDEQTEIKMMLTKAITTEQNDAVAAQAMATRMPLIPPNQMTTDARGAQVSKANEPSEIECWGCGLTGHIRRDCPAASGGGGRGRGRGAPVRGRGFGGRGGAPRGRGGPSLEMLQQKPCLRCGGYGHWQKECPNDPSFKRK